MTDDFLENGRISDCYAFLFNDMFLITKIKKVAVRTKVSLLYEIISQRIGNTSFKTSVRKIIFNFYYDYFRKVIRIRRSIT